MTRKTPGSVVALAIAILIAVVAAAFTLGKFGPGSSAAQPAEPSAAAEATRSDASPEPVEQREPPVEDAPPADRAAVAAPPAAKAGAAPPSAQFLIDKVAELDAKAAEKGWDVKYKDVPGVMLEQRAAEIEAQIYEQTKDEFERRFSAGQYEVLARGTTYVSNDYDPTAVYWVRIPPGGPVQKVTLPKEEFPAVYELRAEASWLRQGASRRPR